MRYSVVLRRTSQYARVVATPVPPHDRTVSRRQQKCTSAALVVAAMTALAMISTTTISIVASVVLRCRSRVQFNTLKTRPPSLGFRSRREDHQSAVPQSVVLRHVSRATGNWDCRSLVGSLRLSRARRCAPPVRATNLPFPAWVTNTQVRNCDKFFGQVVVSNSANCLGGASARGGCDLRAQARLGAGAFRMNRGRPDRGVLPEHAEVMLSQRSPRPLQRQSM
jgi:hypothetical protein